MTAKKLLQIISTILVALVVLLAVALVGVRLAGIRTFTVLSGSMEPTYHVGSLIYVKKVDPTTIRPGQVITFMLDENTVATHRVVEVVPDEDDPSTLRFRTKGDANDTEDGSLVHYKNVIGTPVFAIPKLGYAANYIQHPPGLYVAISAGAVLLLLTFLPDLLSGGSDKEQGKRIRRIFPRLGHGLGQSRKLAAQKLRRSNQRLSSKSSNSQFLLIVRQFHFTVLCLLP